MSELQRPMKGKCQENYRAAAAMSGLSPPPWNAIANRAYYAVYHAGWEALERTGHEPPPRDEGGAYYSHSMNQEHGLQATLKAKGLLKQTKQWMLRRLVATRGKADYLPESVSREEGEKCLDYAAELMEILLPELGAST